MGSIVIDTGFDLSGAEKGYKRLINLTQATARETAGSFDKTSASIVKQQTVIDGLKAKIQALNDIEAKTPAYENLANDLKMAETELANFTSQHEKAVATLTELREIGFKDVDLTTQIADVERLEAAVQSSEGKTTAMRQELAALNMPEKPKQDAEQLAAQLAAATKKLAEMQAKAKQVRATMPKALKQSSAAATGFGSALTKTVTRIKQLLVSIFVFNVLRKAFTMLRNYIGLALKDNKAFASAFAQVKANLATAFQPIFQYIIPALTTLMQWLAKATQYVVMFISALTGRSIKSMQEAAKNMDKLKKSTAGAGSAAKKTTAAFDELNQVQSADTGGAGADNTAPEYAQTDELTDSIKNTIATIAMLLGGALLVLGAILTFSGANIPLGLALLAAGAALLVSAYATQWDTMPGQLRDTIAIIGMIVGGALLVLGVILAFSGANIPLGIGLIAVGAAMLAASYVAQWDSLDNRLRDTIATIAITVGGALLVLGAILAFSGANVPLGIGFLAVGAVVLGAAFAARWDSMDVKIKSTIVQITKIVSLASLVLGAILAFTGANIPLGVGLLALGAIGLAASIIQSSVLTDEIRRTVATIAGIAGAALIALGVMLLCFGEIPLGLALLVAGVGSIFVGIFASPGKDMLEKIKNFVNGILEFFENMANGVISIFERLLNWIVGGLNKISFTLPDFLGGATVGFNISPVQLGRVTIPRLATGTVVPPNKEFMALLGDNKQEPEVVSPISTMKQAFMEAMQEMGGYRGGDIVIEAAGNADEIIRFFTFKIKQEESRRGGSFSNRAVRV